MYGARKQLEDGLLVTLNRAIEKANEVHEAEIGAVAKEGLPNIPGLERLY